MNRVVRPKGKKEKNREAPLQVQIPSCNFSVTNWWRSSSDSAAACASFMIFPNSSWALVALQNFPVVFTLQGAATLHFASCLCKSWNNGFSWWSLICWRWDPVWGGQTDPWASTQTPSSRMNFENSVPAQSQRLLELQSKFSKTEQNSPGKFARDWKFWSTELFTSSWLARLVELLRWLARFRLVILLGPKEFILELNQNHEIDAKDRN